LVKEVKPYGAIELEDLATKRSWVVNGQMVKPFLREKVANVFSIINLKEP
jgi:hypothetical protein